MLKNLGNKLWVRCPQNNLADNCCKKYRLCYNINKLEHSHLKERKQVGGSSSIKYNKQISLNADVSEAYQIIKKVSTKAFANEVECVVVHPVKLHSA